MKAINYIDDDLQVIVVTMLHAVPHLHVFRTVAPGCKQHLSLAHTEYVTDGVLITNHKSISSVALRRPLCRNRTRLSQAFLQHLDNTMMRPCTARALNPVQDTRY